MSLSPAYSSASTSWTYTTSAKIAVINVSTDDNKTAEQKTNELIDWLSLNSFQLNEKKVIQMNKEVIIDEKNESNSDVNDSGSHRSDLKSDKTSGSHRSHRRPDQQKTRQSTEIRDTAPKEREFDLDLFGASGFSGQFVVEEVVRTAHKDRIKWAISGRNEQKLKEVLATASKETGIDVQHIPTIEADISNAASLRAMTARTRLVLNCVRAYRFYREQVVSACVDTSTNHVDISGEPQYMESMQLKYNSAAKEKGIYIVSACGWDSIPCDPGLQFLKKNFNGELNAVETYTTVKAGPQGLRTNYGTGQSAIHGFTAFNELKDIRRRLFTQVFTKRRPQSKYRLSRNQIPFQSQYAEGWCLPFPGSDRSVVERTQQYKYEKLNERPTQIETYFTVANFLALMATIVVGGIFGALASFSWGRSLLEKHPKLFSLGMFSRVGPTREQINGASFLMTIVGKGWNEKLSERTDEPSVPPNKTVVVQVKGKDPGYSATNTCLVQAGFTIL